MIAQMSGTVILSFSRFVIVHDQLRAVNPGLMNFVASPLYRRYQTTLEPPKKMSMGIVNFIEP